MDKNITFGKVSVLTPFNDAVHTVKNWGNAELSSADAALSNWEQNASWSGLRLSRRQVLPPT